MKKLNIAIATVYIIYIIVLVFVRNSKDLIIGSTLLFNIIGGILITKRLARPHIK